MLIDEAIISQCIAMIKYHAPNTADRRKIWRVVTEQFALPLDAALNDQLTELFPSATGRDIKGLTKLVPSSASKNNCSQSWRYSSAVRCFGVWSWPRWIKRALINKSNAELLLSLSDQRKGVKAGSSSRIN